MEQVQQCDGAVTQGNEVIIPYRLNISMLSGRQRLRATVVLTIVVTTSSLCPHSNLTTLQLATESAQQTLPLDPKEEAM